MAAAVSVVAVVAFVSSADPRNSYHTSGLMGSILCVFVFSVLLMFFGQGWKRMSFGAVDVLLSAFVAIYMLSAVRNWQGVSAVAVQEVFPYFVLYLSIRMFIASVPDRAESFFLSLFFLWAGYEAVLGLTQILGISRSGHYLFVLTGSFGNPGPYGGFMAVIFAVSLAYVFRERREFVFSGWRSVASSLPFLLAVASLLLCFIVLPATMSRAGWLAAGAGVLLYFISETDCRGWFLRHRAVSACIASIVLMCGAAAFMMKFDSAIGRFHIWNMEIRAIAESPVHGCAPGMWSGVYGKVQEEYFRQEERDDRIVEVASSPDYAFNEYLKAGMETGIPGLVLALSITVVAIVVLVRRRSVFAYGMTALAVFSLFSYPSDTLMMSVQAVVMLAVSGGKGRPEEMRPVSVADISVLCAAIAVAVAGTAVLHGRYRERSEAFLGWKDIHPWIGMGLYDDAVEELAPLYQELRWNYTYLYDYGYALYKTGRYRESIEVLSEGIGISSQNVFHTMVGRNLEALGEYDAAGKEYTAAHYLIPCRLYPLVLLMEMYMGRGDGELADAVGRMASELPVNPKNDTMLELKRRLDGNMTELERNED